MARKLNVTCQILDIQPIPNSQAQIVSIKFTEGGRSWNKGFRLAYDRPISLEEFMRDLSTKDIWPPEDNDFLHFVKQEMAEPFIISVEKPKV